MMGEKLTDRGWVECGKCGGNGEDPDRCDEYCDQGCCPDCVEGLAPPDGMVEAVADVLDRPEEDWLHWREDVTAGLIAAARWEREQ